MQCQDYCTQDMFICFAESCNVGLLQKPMRTIYLLRHAKSSWSDSSLTDFDRTLNARGQKAAEFMGAYMSEQGLCPQAIVSSPAKRAKETAMLVCSAVGWDIEINYDQRIYEADQETLWAVISEYYEENDPVMLVGHNPGMEALIQRLTGQACTVPTATLAVITLPIDTMPAMDVPLGTLDALIRPKDEMERSLNISNI